MGRELKRVPLDFDYPLHEVWRGKFLTNASKEDYDSFPVKTCKECEEKHGKEDDFCQEEKTPYCVFHNPYWRSKWHEEVPEGEGYQLWENTSEGSPITPVFKTLDELCEYAETHCTTFADFKVSKEEWKKMLSDNFIYHKEGNCMFL